MPNPRQSLALSASLWLVTSLHAVVLRYLPLIRSSVRVENLHFARLLPLIPAEDRHSQTDETYFLFGGRSVANTQITAHVYTSVQMFRQLVCP